MRKHILSILLTLTFSSQFIFAQKPEKIYGKNRVLKTNEYYLEQMELWKKETEKDPKNSDAWYNYYRASRNAYIVGEETRTKESKGKNRFERLNAIVLGMEKNIPESFEYNYVKWLNSYNDPAYFQYLEKAHTIAPRRTEPLMDFVVYYETKGDTAQKNKYAAAYYNSGEYSPGLLNYSYNMLAGLEKDAIIFTEGDKDTEGTWLLQAAKKIRPDVKLLNMNFLFIKEYRERIFKELNIPSLDLDPQAKNEDYENFTRIIISHVAKNIKSRPVYVGATVGPTYTGTIKEKLYLTGLASLYSDTKIDNIPLLTKNIEQVYALDYLKIYLPSDLSEGNVHKFNLNYLPSFAALWDHYLNAGDNAKADYYRNLANKLAVDAGSMEEFEACFGKK